MASEVDICNRALQILGAKRIVSLTQDSVNGRACNTAYASLRDAELRAHPWNFAIKRASLPAASPAPATGGRQNSFPLPPDFLHLLDPYPELLLNTLDWQIEGQAISSNDTGPLAIRYIWQVTDPNMMDPLFREALSNRLALGICEELTQSNVKHDDIEKDYIQFLREARRINAIESVAAFPPEDSYITLRN